MAILRQTPYNVSVVIAPAANRAKIWIFPHLAVRPIKDEFALKNFFGECFHGHDVVDLRDFAVVTNSSLEISSPADIASIMTFAAGLALKQPNEIQL
jgi:hypothetical protein